MKNFKSKSFIGVCAGLTIMGVAYAAQSVNFKALTGSNGEAQVHLRIYNFSKVYKQKYIKVTDASGMDMTQWPVVPPNEEKDANVKLRSGLSNAIYSSVTRNTTSDHQFACNIQFFVDSTGQTTVMANPYQGSTCDVKNDAPQSITLTVSTVHS